ncbi:hypothetical protein ACFQ0F_06040 [Paraperlucidibaca wandonensis]|uniref:Lipoprotein n=1 Tax=Paraperlucidibaca wandonensis TaxID=1268273 RepID=A0ABW3HF96_9GAMM
MHNLHIAIISIVLMFFLSSCSQEELSERFIPKEESDFAEDYLSKLRGRDFTYVKSILSPEIEAQITDELLEEMAGYFRQGEPLSVKIIGSQVNVFNGQWQGNFTFEYEFESGWNLANTALKKIDNGYEVIGLNVYQTEISQKELNAFGFSSKSGMQYFVLCAAVLVPLFILCTLIVCIRTPIERKKWLWVIFILLGFGAIQVNWTNGVYAFQLLSVQLLGASATASGVAAPWVLSASVPLGAIVFWLRRKSLIERANKSSQQDASDTGASA